MTTLISQPVIPPQPDSLAYGIQDLGLFSSYTRDSYLAAFGIQAPAWNPAWPAKSWFDSTVDTSNPANVALYKVISRDGSGDWGYQQMVLPAQQAAAVNLPGAITYPPYAVAPTQATRGGAPVNPQYLSLQSDAEALMAALGGTALMDEGVSTVFPIVYPPNEPRRVWDFTVNGQSCNAGSLLFLQNANGVGAPGHWNLSETSPVWVPDPPAPTGVGDTRPPVNMPVRDLLPNEKLQTGLMGVSVVRTDLQQQVDQQAGQFTSDDRATLQQIFQIVSKL